MSVPVALSELAKVLENYRFAYLLTTSDDGRPHVLAVTPGVEGANLGIGGVGRRTAHNISARSDVTLLWPPSDVDEYSLIVDGRAALEGTRTSVQPVRAVLHRPAPGPEPAEAGSCTSDCIEVPLPGNSTRAD